MVHQKFDPPRRSSAQCLRQMVRHLFLPLPCRCCAILGGSKEVEKTHQVTWGKRTAWPSSSQPIWTKRSKKSSLFTTIKHGGSFFPHVSSTNVGQMRAPSSLDQPLLARNIMTPLGSTSHHQPTVGRNFSRARRHGRSKVSVQRLKLPLTSQNQKNHRLNHSWDDWKIVGLRFESYHVLRLSVYLISAFHPLWNWSGAARATKQIRPETQQTHVTALP